MECKEARECCSEYIDECLEERHREFEEHLLNCPICQRQVKELNVIVDALRSLPQVDVSPDFTVMVNQRIDSKEISFTAWFKSLIEPSRMSHVIATAATLALVLLASFYFSNTYKGALGGDLDVTERVAGPAMEGSFLDGRTSVYPPITLPSPTERAIPPDHITRPVVIPITPVTHVSSPAPPSTPTTPVSIRRTARTVDIPGMMEIGSIPLPTPRNVPYVDKVVMLRVYDTDFAADQVRKVVAGLSGLHLDYSENVIFTLVAIEKVDPLLQALETMGSAEIINGPIDRGLPTVLFQVIVIPEH